MRDVVKAAVPQQVGVRELRGKLTHVLREVRLGRSFLVTVHDQVVAEINPPQQPDRPSREPGALRGKIWMAPDFDTLPPDILAAMEGGEV
jgi:antitoxin (DNA-binding transcriptional repressor) of toxin-antitoxin stability system